LVASLALVDRRSTAQGLGFNDQLAQVQRIMQMPSGQTLTSEKPLVWGYVRTSGELV
jgi:hypothetical protein